MKKHLHEMTDEEQTQHIRRNRRRWTWGSVLGLLGTIATIAVAWPQINGLIHWSVGLMDAVDNIKDVQTTQMEMKRDMNDGFNNVNSNLVIINYRLAVIEHRTPRNMEVTPTPASGALTVTNTNKVAKIDP